MNLTTCHNPHGNKRTKEYKYTTVEVLYNGIDRLDNSEGYNTHNTVPCCKIYNGAKTDLSLDEWDSWVERLSNVYLSKKQNR